ncbi:Zinc finger BED domain-containing protein 4, partial [Aphis craccivora]
KQVAISSRATNILSKSSIEKILNNTFWDKIEMALNLLEPISKWITILESDSSNLSHTCIAFHSIQMHLNKTLLHSFLTKEEENLIIQKLGKRKTMALKKIHFAAHLLDGNNKGKCLDNSESIDAVEYISSLCARMNLNIPDILSELAMYRSCEGLWSKKFIWDSLKKRSDGTQIGLLTWWKGICSSSKLSQIAIAILSCPPTSASTERSFSTYGLIHTAKRNRLTNERAAKLVYIKHNLKLNDVPKQVKIGPCDDYIEPEMSEVDEEEVHLYLSDSEDNEEN